ncbi:histidine phosphatase family protein [Pseudomonas entomophila]|uniref:histidine phosphatase family protein n=1 Tax=Pseudomonas entomophila TaxID=312306 RepID=UPI0023D7D394|nr:histidine phosphatase family protein [Pseudomonas entomophila]MDF0733609.1 histidine phosphatase family protein [Pseudomonas entomophila]
MKAVRLTLICHALTQAQKVGRFPCAEDAILALDEPVLAVASELLCAPERRATQTAALLGPALRLEPALADCDMGRWQGVALKQLQQEEPDALAQWLQDPTQAPHGGESVAALCQRVERWLRAFDTPGEWLAVTHPMVMRAAMVALLGCPLAAFQRIDVPPLSRLSLSHAGQWRLRLA